MASLVLVRQLILLQMWHMDQIQIVSSQSMLTTPESNNQSDLLSPQDPFPPFSSTSSGPPNAWAAAAPAEVSPSLQQTGNATVVVPPRLNEAARADGHAPGQHGYFFLDPTICSEARRSKEKLTFVPEDGQEGAATLEINIESDAPSIDCQWFLPLLAQTQPSSSVDVDGRPPPNIVVMFDQLSPSLAGPVNISQLAGARMLRYEETDIRQSHVIDLSDLFVRDPGALLVRSPATLAFQFYSEAPHLARSLRLRFWREYGAINRTLPVVRLSPNAGYVTSPRFDELLPRYPLDYAGYFRLEVQQDESVLINFVQFMLEGSSDFFKGCAYDFLIFSVEDVHENASWTKCGQHKMPPRVYRGAVSLYFVSDRNSAYLGFKMLYAIMPRSQEPEIVSGTLFDCSVPRFDLFAPVFRCNFVAECAGGEDERDCDFHTEECEEGYVDAGERCYRYVRAQARGISWNAAQVDCLKKNERLVTLATPKEYEFFLHVLSHVKHPADVYIGAQLSAHPDWPASLAWLYKTVWRWTDDRSAFYINMASYVYKPFSLCGGFFYSLNKMAPYPCFEDYPNDFVCERDKPGRSNLAAPLNEIQMFQGWPRTRYNVSMVTCPAGHVVRDFLSCDVEAQCGSDNEAVLCRSKDMDFPLFACAQSTVSVHYTLVCDHVRHCPDDSDEDFCFYPPCSVMFMKCLNAQCIPLASFCDERANCADLSDEASCSDRMLVVEPVPCGESCLISMDRLGQYSAETWSDPSRCPDTHFLCPGGPCLPVFLRCNGVVDCPGFQDEAGCETYACPGHYRCRGSSVCLHPDHVCDGVLHCPQQDDEMLCNPQCPKVCRCQGLAFRCLSPFNATGVFHPRYLDASGSAMKLSDLASSTYLVRLHLSRCEIRDVEAIVLPNLRHLDLSWNRLTVVDMASFAPLNNLHVLILSGNPFSEIISSYRQERYSRPCLEILDLSFSDLRVYDGTVFTRQSRLKHINASMSQLRTIVEPGFETTPLLATLDLRGCPLFEYPRNVLKGLADLKTVYSDDYKLCCREVLPAGFDLKNCQTKLDPFSSCEDLLKSSTFRISLWIFAALAIVGNTGSFVTRLYPNGVGIGSFGVFVMNLIVADFFMGVYLVIIGAADFVYQGQYLFNDLKWKNSALCRTSGFLSMLSHELSALSISLITIDRFFVLRFPFSRVRFGRRSALVACGVIWIASLTLAAVPLLPQASGWRFFAQNGLCLPLPFSPPGSFPGHTYSFSVLIVLNLLLFLLVAHGQLLIYWAVRANTLQGTESGSSGFNGNTNRDTRARDGVVARRLFAVALADFLRWFPIGLIGVLTFGGLAVAQEVSVAVAIFVLPLNAALNPFFYTLNVLLEKRRRARELRLLDQLQSRFRSVNSAAMSRV